MKWTILLIQLIIIAFLALSPWVLWAQEQPAGGVIEGRVMMRGDRESVEFADVTIEELGMDTSTDEKGYFRIENVPPGEYTVTVREENIKDYTFTISVIAGETAEVKCYVHREGYLLDEIVVVGEKETGDMTRQKISKDELTGVPGANNDVIRVVENLPGVAATSVMGFGNDGLVIRGTSSGDSSYMLNGFEIPQLFHFGGFISIVNSELVDDIAYYPGGFGVQYGDTVGGVVEVTSRSPRTDRFGGVVDLNTYASYMMFEGPVSEKTSMAVGVRRSFIDFILPEVVPEDEAEFTLSPRFYDYQGMFNYMVNTKNNLEVNVFGSDDAMGALVEQDNNDPFSGDSFKARMIFHRADARWKYRPSDRLSNSLAVNFLYMHQNFEFGPGYTIDFDRLTPAMRDDFSVRIGSWNELRAGVDAKLETGTIELEVIRPPKEGDPNVSLSSDDVLESDESWAEIAAGGYVDNVIKPANWLQMVPGFRMDYHAYLDAYSYDPRLNLKFYPTAAATIKASTGLYSQWPEPDEFLDNFGSTELEAEVATLGALGFEYDFGQGWDVDVEGYYKDINNRVVPTETGSEEPYDNSGKGRVYGAEFLARKKLTDRLFGWTSYTYSVSERKDSPDDDWRYFDEDQRHNFIILASYMLGQNKQWRIGAKWQYSTGLPYTEIEGAAYNADTDSYLPMYSDDINEKRRGDYHKLDVRLDKLWTFNTWNLNTYLDVQNAYWNQYPDGYAYNFDYSEKKAVSFPAFMPTIGAQARF